MSLDIEIGANVSEANARLTKLFADIKKSVNEVGTTVQKGSDTFQKSTEKMTESTRSFAKASQNSLTALSLTLQDLPFGFIGIQNNLPGIIQGFGQMNAEAKNGASVLSQLKNALLGPAGIYLAFSAVSAIVTKLSMEYGSLGNAIDALFGKVNPLAKVIKDAAKSQEELNESYKTSGQIIASATGSVEAQILKVKLLSDTVKNLSNSEELRKNALSELQKIDKAYFGQITTAIGDVDKLEAATRKYTEAIIANAIAKAYEQKVTQGAINLEEQRNLLKDLAPAYAEATKKQKEFLKSYQDAYDPVTGAKLVQPSFIATKDIEAFNKQKVVVDAAIIAQDKLKQSFSDATTEALKFVEPLEQGGKAVKEFYSNFPESTALGPVEAFSRFVIGSTNLQVKAIDKLIKERVKLRKETSKEESAALAPTTLVGGEAFVDLKNIIQLAKDAAFAIDVAAIEKTFQDLYNVLNNTFFNPISELFTSFLSTGKFAFDDFRKSISSAITQLVSQIVATGIIQLLATLFSGGFGATAGKNAGTSGFLAGITNVLSGIGKAIGIGKIANPSFSGVGAGAMGMTGQVNLVLRGSDLVGSLNRTNATINRVG